MENVRKRIDVKLVNNKKDYLKCTSKPSYMLHKVFDNNLVTIRKSKLELKLNKPSYTGMCISEFSKVLMYEFHYDYIRNKYENKSKLLFTDTDSLMYEIKTEDVYKDFSRDFSNYSTQSKYYDNSNTLFILEFVGLKPKMYSFLVDNNEHKKVKGMNKNGVATISHNEYKDVLLNKKFIRHSVNRIQIEDHKIGTYEMKKI